MVRKKEKDGDLYFSIIVGRAHTGMKCSTYMNEWKCRLEQFKVEIMVYVHSNLLLIYKMRDQRLKGRQKGRQRGGPMVKRKTKRKTKRGTNG
jgi:hypothetical protein